MNCCGCGSFDFCITQGSSFLAVDLRALCVDSVGCQWPVGLSAITMIIEDVNGGCGCPLPAEITLTGVYKDGPPPKVCFDLTQAQSYQMAAGTYRHNYKIYATTGQGSRIVLRSGRISVNE